MTDDTGWRPFDSARWLHESQTVDEPEEARNLTPRRELTKARRKSNNEDRQTRGDRQDWRQHLKPLPSAYRLAPEETLTRQQKASRTLSIKAALSKRKGRVPQIDTRREPTSRKDWREEQRREQMQHRVYFPDEEHYGAYPWEPELRRLEEWFLPTFGGDSSEIRCEIEHGRRRWELSKLTHWMAGQFPEYDSPLVDEHGPTGHAPASTNNPTT